MVSVERFVHDEPALFAATQRFVQIMRSVPDPIVFVARKAKNATAQIAWTLLGTALFQDRLYSDILRLMDALYKRFPDEKLWELPVPKAKEIEDVVEGVFESRNWTVFENVAGIFWSVGLFVRHHPDLELWVRERTPEEMWRDLGEIYFMGKSSVRPKACAAIYRLLTPAPVGLGFSCRDNLRMPPIPLTMGLRRFLAILGPAKESSFSELEPATKQKLANEYCSALSPDAPYLAAHALQFFLEEGTEDFICRECTEKCARCPLYEFCGYASHHDKGCVC
ncbi:MAG: hypothetical protein MJY99_12585 [Fibrobacter sp.]|nr:hypothetical protein [Fibrobacter sp.]